MPQLPSGLKVALTIEPILKEIQKGNFGFNLLAKVNILDSFDAFPEVVTIIYLNDKPDTSEPTHAYQPGTQSIGADKYQFSKIFLANVGTERCDWSTEDVEFFKSWLSGETEQQWLRKSYDELLDALKTTKTSLPDNLKGILDADDDNFPSVNLDKPEQELPDSVIELIGELIKRDNVQSVSCPFNNSKVWRLLVDEQVHRAKLSGLSLQKAFTLSGTDGGFSFDPADWGGDVHIPYEGACMGDLFVLPEWRNLFTEHAKYLGESATLGSYVIHEAHTQFMQPCHYLLMQRDIGEIYNANRKVVGDGWYLYESTQSYVKVNMSGLTG
jgi:hypothetical protein